MARPLKVGLDYFPHDVDASSDEKIEYLRAIFKNDGYAFYFMILERIYRTNEGKLSLDEIHKSILAKKIGISLRKFDKILNTCLKKSLFSQSEFEHNSVLTSQGIQKRFLEIQNERARKRKNYKGNGEVLDGQNTGETPGEIEGETEGETGQSKGKESKAKHLIEEKFIQLWKIFSNDLGQKGSRQEALKEFQKLNPNDELFNLMIQAAEAQTQQKQMLKDRGKFSESFPHISRWIKNQRWTDEIDIEPIKKVLELS